MSETKQKMVKIIDEQPDDSSYDEILRELVFASLVEHGLADSDARRVMSNDEMKLEYDFSKGVRGKYATLYQNRNNNAE